MEAGGGGWTGGGAERIREEARKDELEIASTPGKKSILANGGFVCIKLVSTVLISD